MSRGVLCPKSFVLTKKTVSYRGARPKAEKSKSKCFTFRLSGGGDMSVRLSLPCMHLAMTNLIRRQAVREVSRGWGQNVVLMQAAKALSIQTGVLEEDGPQI